MSNSSNPALPGIPGFLARFERTIAIAFLALLAALKLFYVFALRGDSDETQHLHVVWGWANGWIPYRDFFDNHSPLFQFLCTPLFRALGERADIVMATRLAMIPFYFLCLWFVYRCGTILFSRRAGIWAAILTGAYPTFFVKSTEFRTDDLWAPLWMLSILALLQSPLRLRNAFLAGLTLGACFATSMKTSALVLSLGLAFLLVLAAKVMDRAGVDWKRLTSLAAVALFGATLVPAMVVAFFAHEGALPNLYYGVIQHNVLPGSLQLDISKRVQVFLLLTLLSLVAGCLSWRKASDTARRNRIAMIALTSTAFCLLLSLCWPIVEPQDVLPIAPFVFLLVVAAIQNAPKFDGSFSLPLVASAEIIALLLLDPPRLHALDDTTAMISNVLRLTTKDDFVMDAKGEMVFRRRAFYYALEGLTNSRLQLGLIKDEIPERLIATRAPVATILRTPPRARSFIEQNYIPVAFHVRVLGQMLKSNDQEIPKNYEFDVVIPASYALVPERGNPKALLDGTPFDGPRYLPPGHHEVSSLADTGRLAVLWSVASEKGFSPFSARAIDAFK